MADAPRTPRRGNRWGLRLGLVGALLVTVAGAGAGLRFHYLPTTVVAPGLMIDGERVTDGADLAKVRALVESRAAALAARKVAFVMPGDPTSQQQPVLDSTFGDMGLRVDIEQTIAIASRIGKDGDAWSRVKMIREARAGHIDVPLRLHVDRDVAFTKIDALKETTDTEAVSARLDLDKHATIPERDGRYVDPDATVARLEAAARDHRSTEDKGARVELPIATFAPRI